MKRVNQLASAETRKQNKKNWLHDKAEIKTFKNNL